jgi:D-glycero-D-manno-heptose 1,7-bisphosphate phosphatase
MKSLALFLDRDGVVNTETNYVWRIEDFNFVDNIFRLCDKFQTEGYKIFIVTNQSGISRGYYSEQDYLKLTQWMIERFLEKEIIISKVY